MAKEDVKATEPKVEEPKVEVHPEGTIEIGTAPGEFLIAHKKKDGSDVVIKVTTH